MLLNLRQTCAAIILALIPMVSMSQRVIFTPADSARIERILSDITSNDDGDAGRQIIKIANEFVGEKYVGGTLDANEGEPLFVSCTKLDCSTFVELVLAIHITATEGKRSFGDVCDNLEKIRYRNGKNCGYASRLHYSSWWIDDGIEKGILQEMTPSDNNKKQRLELNYMSTHPDSYRMLAGNTAMIKEIAAYEKPYRGTEVDFIPKSILKSEGADYIQEGDIIAITTSKAGLDIAHVGFAYYHNNKLHLLHASSAKKEVIRDRQPLNEYLMARKSHTGIRVIRCTK